MPTIIWEAEAPNDTFLESQLLPADHNALILGRIADGDLRDMFQVPIDGRVLSFRLEFGLVRADYAGALSLAVFDAAGNVLSRRAMDAERSVMDVDLRGVDREAGNWLNIAILLDTEGEPGGSGSGAGAGTTLLVDDAAGEQDSASEQPAGPASTPGLGGGGGPGSGLIPPD